MKGKLSADELKSLIFSNINIKNDDILVKPSLGEDCTTIKVGSELVAMTMDPITATAEHLGKLLVRINVNDVATSGAKPMYMMATLLMPTHSDKKDLELIMKDVKEEIDFFGIDLIGGHTEFTSAVNVPVACAVMIAKKDNSRVLSLANVREGDSIIMTGSAGIEGTGILAAENYDELSARFGRDFADRALSYIDRTVILDVALRAAEIGVRAMHDVTEGGVLGAIWEMVAGAGLGCEIIKENIPVDVETENICEYFDINPLRLIGSGAMIMIVEDKNTDHMMDELKRSGARPSYLGKVTKSGLYVCDKENRTLMDEPHSDEIYSVL